MGLLPDWLKSNKSLNCSSDAQQFIVSYQNLEIGTLSYDGKKYKFEYSEDFKKQDDIGAIDNFMDKNKIYESKYLFPFFLARIPDPNRPIIKEERERKGIGADPLSMLDYFSRQTLDNPFIVEKVRV